MVVESLQTVGAARSIVIDEDNVILAGNGVTEAAREAGITKLRIIDTDGDEVIAVRRTGLTDAQKHHLSVSDNRSGELSTWNVQQLRADVKKGRDLGVFFTEKEQLQILQVREDESVTKGSPEKAMQLAPDREYLVVMCGNAAEWEALKTRLNLPLVRRGGYKKNSPFDAVSVQRVLAATDLLARLKD